MSTSDISDETVGRLSSYIDYLRTLVSQQEQVVSSQELAVAVGVNPAQVRKDFSFLVPYGLGYFGTPGVGYQVQRLLTRLSEFVGLTREHLVVLVGYGSLGAALAHYRGFSERNYRLVAIFDVDPTKVGSSVGAVPVYHSDRIGEVVPQTGAEIAIISTPAAAAPAVAERLAAAGIRAVLNFAPTVLGLPASVTVRQVDLSKEIQLLSFRAGEPRPRTQRQSSVSS